MKDKEMKRLLTEYAGEPDFAGKDDFIRSIRKVNPTKPANSLKMILVNVRYIRAYVWILSLFVLGFAFSNYEDLSIDKVSSLAGFMPFFAGFGMIEVFRARENKMYELEKVTLFSGKGVFFAKSIAVGSVQLITILIASVFVRISMEVSAFAACISILIPFLLTNIICINVERTKFGRENEWSCLAVASAVFVARRLGYPRIYYSVLGDSRVLFLVALVLLAIQVYEIIKTVKTEEKLSWN